MPLMRADATPVLKDTGATLEAPELDLGNLHGSSESVIVMVHGYKFAPGHPVACPHRHILSLAPTHSCRKLLSWPCALGLSEFESGSLGLAFGWPARGSIWAAYHRAAAAGTQLAALLGQIHRTAPDRPIVALAHSLGVRVVLNALSHMPAGIMRRAVLLNGAEYGSRARQCLDTPGGRSCEIINVTSRENDLYDFLLERLITPAERGDSALATSLPDGPNTLTIQLDHSETHPALASLGFPICPRRSAICHWSAYLRPGVFSLYRGLLNNPEGIALSDLKQCLPQQVEPRWSRLLNTPKPRASLPGKLGATI